MFGRESLGTRGPGPAGTTAYRCGCVSRMRISDLRGAREEPTMGRKEPNVRSIGAMILTASHCPLHVLCRGPIQTFFKYLEPRAACLGLLHRLNDACTALLAVLGARPGLLVLDDVLALRAIWVVPVLLQVGLVDPEGSRHGWSRLHVIQARPRYALLSPQGHVGVQ